MYATVPQEINSQRLGRETIQGQPNSQQKENSVNALLYKRQARPEKPTTPEKQEQDQVHRRSRITDP
jgi:hypothetical protein